MFVRSYEVDGLVVPRIRFLSGVVIVNASFSTAIVQLSSSFSKVGSHLMMLSRIMRSRKDGIVVRVVFIWSLFCYKVRIFRREQSGQFPAVENYACVIVLAFAQMLLCWDQTFSSKGGEVNV